MLIKQMKSRNEDIAQEYVETGETMVDEQLNG